MEYNEAIMEHQEAFMSWQEASMDNQRASMDSQEALSNIMKLDRVPMGNAILLKIKQDDAIPRSISEYHEASGNTKKSFWNIKKLNWTRNGFGQQLM